LRPRDSLSCAFAVANEVAAAYDLAHILQRADYRREIERGIERAAKPALSPDGGAQRAQRDDCSQPRNGSDQLASDSTACILSDLAAYSHGERCSKTYS
jgi:hypothetical protein